MKRVDVKTIDGIADCYAFYPEKESKLPPVIFYMDVFGVRDALFEMAQRIANWGYYVLVPNLYYRAGAKQSFSTAAFMNASEEKDKMLHLMQSLSMERVMADTQCYLDFVLSLDNTASKAACTGYCMGGRYAMGAAGYFPDKIVAAAIFHGSKLATLNPDSPHLLAPRIQAEIYIGIAAIDPNFTDEEKDRLEERLQSNGLNYQTELYADAKHGFAVLDAMAYDKAASEKHFEALHGLLKRAFGD